MNKKKMFHMICVIIISLAIVAASIDRPADGWHSMTFPLSVRYLILV